MERSIPVKLHWWVLDKFKHFESFLSSCKKKFIILPISLNAVCNSRNKLPLEFL